MKRPDFSHRRPARKRYYLVDKPTPIERDTFDWKPDEVVIGLRPRATLNELVSKQRTPPERIPPIRTPPDPEADE
jgi:hypothetical protein